MSIQISDNADNATGFPQNIVDWLTPVANKTGLTFRLSYYNEHMDRPYIQYIGPDAQSRADQEIVYKTADALDHMLTQGDTIEHLSELMQRVQTEMEERHPWSELLAVIFKDKT